MDLTFECVICGDLIKLPKIREYTCGKKFCLKKYHYYMVCRDRNLFKLKQFKKKGDKKNV